MDTIEQIWQQIEANSSQAGKLRPGASEESVAAAERQLGMTLPADVRASFRRHDGGYSLEPVIDMDVLPLSEVAKRWSILEELSHDPEWVGQQPYYFSEDVVRSGWQAGPIQPIWWNRNWIPIAQDGAGNLTCVDLAPTEYGTVGQIIDWDHECGPSRMLFRSFTDLLAELVSRSYDGSARYD